MFIRRIGASTLKHGALELPDGFVKENWESLSNDACLKVPTGANTEMRLKKRDGEAWLCRGWRNFVQKYSIKKWYLIMFEYLGRSNFSVRICDWTTQEIVYQEADSHAKKEVDSDTEEEDDDEDDDDQDHRDKNDDCPTESDYEMEMDNHSEEEEDDDNGQTESEKDSESESGQKSSLAENNNQRSKELRSRIPAFSVVMQPAYVTTASRATSYMHIPSHAASYFRKNGKDDIELSINGGFWFLKYYGGSSSSLGRIGSGWKEFSEGNNLKEGDECTFEPISMTDMKFKVTIKRKKGVAGTKKPTNVERIRKRKRSSSVEEERSFTVTLRKTNVGSQSRLNVPKAHSASHLLDQDRKEVVLRRADGKKWCVTCHIYGGMAKFYAGWKGFVDGNDLKVGDTCVFELSPRKPNYYNVTISSG